MRPCAPHAAVLLLIAGIAVAPPAAGHAPDRIRSLDATHYVVPRALYARYYANPTPLETSVRIWPTVAPPGWELGKIAPGSLAAAAGFRDGDVVQTIDGTALTLATADAIYARLGHAARVTVGLVRHGRRLVLTYLIR